jgi:hypothetical protein
MSTYISRGLLIIAFLNQLAGYNTKQLDRAPLVELSETVTNAT